MVGGAVMLPLCHRLVENIVCQQFDEIVHGGLFLRAAKCFGSRYVGKVAEFAVEILRFVLVVVETDFYAYGKAYFAGYGLSCGRVYGRRYGGLFVARYLAFEYQVGIAFDQGKAGAGDEQILKFCCELAAEHRVDKRCVVRKIVYLYGFLAGVERYAGK